MIVSNNSSQLEHFTNLSHGRRASTVATTSPPSYEATLAADDAPATASDEKTYNEELLHNSCCNDPSIIKHSSDGKEVYSETPPAFSRTPTLGPQSSESFSPMEVEISGSARSLDKGLPSGLPEASTVPHPFEQRDINEDDWNRFIQDLRDGTTLPKWLGKALLIPPAAIVLGAYLLNKAIKAKIRAKKLKYAISVINTWNQSFFAPRGVEVILMRGETKLTATEPVTASQKLINRHDQSSDSVSRRQNDSTSKGHGCCMQPQEPLRLLLVSTADTA